MLTISIILFIVTLIFKPNINDLPDLQVLPSQINPKGLCYFRNPQRSNGKTSTVIKLHKAPTETRHPTTHDKLPVLGYRATPRLNLILNNQSYYSMLCVLENSISNI